MSQSLPGTADVFRETLLSWSETHYREFPWRERDQSFYEVFVAEFFLTQTPADNVADVYPTFLHEYPTLTAVREADPKEVEETIEPLGFQRMRTDALTQIADAHDELPYDREELTSLPRVGRYVADATLCFACERPLPIVDRNVVRVYDRVFGSSFPDDASDRREFANRMLPLDGAEARRYNLALLNFGALLCHKREPECSACFASQYCRYYQSSTE